MRELGLGAYRFSQAMPADVVADELHMHVDELLELCAQLDRTGLLHSHRVASWVMGGRIDGGPSRLASMIGVRPRRTTDKSSSSDKDGHGRNPKRSPNQTITHDFLQHRRSGHGARRGG